MDKGLWYVYTIEYYLAIKRKPFEPVPVRWMNLEPIRQNEVSQKEKNKYHILMHMYGILHLQNVENRLVDTVGERVAWIERAALTYIHCLMCKTHS